MSLSGISSPELREMTTPSRGSLYGPPNWFVGRVYSWVRYPAMDHLVLIPVLLWMAAAHWGFLPLFFEEMDRDSKKALFQTLATLAGTTAGLTLTSVSIMVNLVKTPLSTLDQLLPKEDKRRVGGVFLAALPKLALTLLSGLAAFAVQSVPGSGSNWVLEGLLLWFASAAFCSLCRIVWVLRRLLKLST